MSLNDNRTPERSLMIGCTGFGGIDSIPWETNVVPNIPDYDLVIISVPHITKKFLISVDGQFFKNMRRALAQFLHTKGKIVVLASPRLTVNRPSKFPQKLSNLDWCPLILGTPEESGRSIIRKELMYPSYLQKMTEWSFYFTIPSSCLSDELIDFYGPAYKIKYRVPLKPYLENRYGRVLAGQCRVEVTEERERSTQYGNTWKEYPDSPDVTTGQIILLPLLDKISPEEALADILKDEIGFSAVSPEPDWAKNVEMPFVSEWKHQISERKSVVQEEQQKIDKFEAQIGEICSYRQLLYSTGPELEEVVRRSFQYLGGTVTPAKYSQEEYIFDFDGQEFLVEVKGVSKSVSLSHLRQLNDYLLKFQEDTGKEGKGVLFANTWRNLPPEQRNTEDTPEFPDNVVQRAEQWEISLVSSRAFFEVFLQALKDKSLSKQILKTVTSTNGIAQF